MPALILTMTVTPTVIVVIGLTDWPSALIIVITLPLIPLFMILVGLMTGPYRTEAGDDVAAHGTDTRSDRRVCRRCGHSGAQGSGWAGRRTRRGAPAVDDVGAAGGVPVRGDSRAAGHPVSRWWLWGSGCGSCTGT